MSALDGATHCALTGLLNRREFEQRFEQERAAMRADDRHALVFIDFEGVFRINQDHGWPAGDEVLGQAGAAIRSCVGEHGIAGRLGGCQFLVLMKDTPLQRAVEVAEELARTIEEMRVDWQGATLGVSIWASVVQIGHRSPGPAECWGAVLRAAQLARTEARSSGEFVRSGVRIAELPRATDRTAEASARPGAEQDLVSESTNPVQQMLYQASHDALTRLLNRREWERRLQESIEAARADGRRSVVCYLDLDRFRLVNHECGHMAGDALLCELAAAIQRAVPEYGSVARIGGDEFGILLSDCSFETATQIADEFLRAVADHRFVWEDRSLKLTASVGLVEIWSESGSLADVMFKAESMCHWAKLQGGGRVCSCSASDEAAARQRGEIRWLQLLQSALKDNGFELHAQPIVAADGDLATVAGLEVLLRLKDEGGVAVPLAELMRVAERYRLMPHVDRWVVQTAFAALGRGAFSLPPGRSLFISLSGQSLGDAAFLDFVVDCFDRTGVAPERVCFEVAEESIASDIESARRFMGVLHTMGCRFGIAAFGSGPISFANLKNLMVDCIRVESDLLREIASDEVNQAMFAAMIELARSRGIQVIVEQGPVVAFAIDWEVGGEHVFGLKVHADGSLQRMGAGLPSCEDKSLYRGTTLEELLPGMLAGADPELFTHQGLTVLEPIGGQLCKLSVHFWREHGGSQAFEVWYGSASVGPSPAITAFVANAIKRTNPWYAWMQQQGQGSHA